MISRISEILKINNESDFDREFSEFELALTNELDPLRNKLRMVVLTNDVPNLELHMTYVESWRDRVSHYLSFAIAFVEHGKSLDPAPNSKDKVTERAQRVFEKRLTAGFVALASDLENLIDSIDSRVNNCKKLIGVESDLAPRRHYA